MTAELEITPSLISFGVPNHDQLCPAAFALRKAFPKARKISVGRSTISLELNNRVLRGETPPELREFIHAFDATAGKGPGSSAEPRPGKYTVDLDKEGAAGAAGGDR